MLQIIYDITSVFMIATIMIKMIVTNKGIYVLFMTWYTAAIVMFNVGFTVWIGMYQAAKVKKAKQTLMSSFEGTVEMDAGITFITEDVTNAVEPDTSVFNYLKNLLQRNSSNGSWNIGDFASICIAAAAGVLSPFQAKSLVQHTTSVKRPTTKFFKRSFALIKLIFLVLSIAVGVQSLSQVSLQSFLHCCHNLHWHTNLPFIFLCLGFEWHQHR